MIFEIKKGHHYSNQKLHKILNFFCWHKTLSYKVTFDASASYIDDSVDRFDINKLFGFSIGDLHKNSARFGWDYLDGNICLYTYCYVDGKRISSLLMTLKRYKEYTLTITDNGDNYLFTAIGDNKKIESRVTKIKVKGFRCKLWPYFGGNKTSPQDIKIEMK